MINEMFANAFFIKAFYAGILLATINALVGIVITARKQAFLADGVAHASLAGVAFGIVYAGYPLVMALVVALAMSALITYMHRKGDTAYDSAIGIVYTFFFAVGILILSSSSKYQPELSSYLFGSILAVSWGQIWLAGILLVVILIGWVKFKTQITYFLLDEQSAYVRGVKTARLDYALSMLSSMVVVIGVNLLGVVLVTSMLIIPATFARSTATKFAQLQLLAVGFALVGTVVGLIGSYLLNTPSGSTIVIVQCAMLLGHKVLGKYG